MLTFSSIGPSSELLPYGGITYFINSFDYPNLFYSIRLVEMKLNGVVVLKNSEKGFHVLVGLNFKLDCTYAIEILLHFARPPFSGHQTSNACSFRPSCRRPLNCRSGRRHFNMATVTCPHINQ